MRGQSKGCSRWKNVGRTTMWAAAASSSRIEMGQFLNRIQAYLCSSALMCFGYLTGSFTMWLMSE